MKKTRGRRTALGGFCKLLRWCFTAPANTKRTRRESSRCLRKTRHDIIMNHPEYSNEVANEENEG